MSSTRLIVLGVVWAAGEGSGLWMQADIKNVQTAKSANDAVKKLLQILSRKSLFHRDLFGRWDVEQCAVLHPH
jgi:hypothetical protein